MNPFKRPVVLKAWEILAIVAVSGILLVIATSFGFSGWLAYLLIMSLGILGAVISWLWK